MLNLIATNATLRTKQSDACHHNHLLTHNVKPHKAKRCVSQKHTQTAMDPRAVLKHIADVLEAHGASPPPSIDQVCGWGWLWVCKWVGGWLCVCGWVCGC